LQENQNEQAKQIKKAMNLSSAAMVAVGVVRLPLADLVHWRPNQRGKTHQSLCLGLVKGAEALA
jgi:hypothetical protein